MPEADPFPTAEPMPREGQRPRKASNLRTLVALVMREMSTTYGRSALGYLWAILEPAAGIILLTAIFSLAFRAPSIGTNFPLFFASGLLPFMAYTDLSQKTASALRFSRQLLAYPGVTFIDALMARLVLNTLTHLMIFSVVLTSILVIYRVDVILDPAAIALGFGMALYLAAGVGMLNCYLTSTYPVWERAWGILTRPLFFISGILFTFESVPRPYSEYLWWNPLIHVIGQVRSGIYATYDASYVSHVYVFLFGGIPMTLGMMLLRRYHRDILNR
ncbi:ABC transporter permease [Thalassococcus sp. BH17M4-6]|uniref:ABC transporter permease n=1 Tax=Thalassococcus sp. BH17M4-6 TaxID=3413148 RepID=UPI003BCD2D6C